MAGVLNFSQYLGGPDQVNCEQVFPSDQRTLQYNFGVNIVNWDFQVEQQVVVVDTVAFDRNTGTPNFANSQVIGYFPSSVIVDTDVASNQYLTVLNSSAGIVNITLPKNMYTGPIIADARKNVPINVVSVQWKDAGTPPQIASHRWAFIQCWEPGVNPNDPTTTTGTGFISIAV